MTRRRPIGRPTGRSASGRRSRSPWWSRDQLLTAIPSNAQAARRLLAADRADLAEIGEILADIVEDDTPLLRNVAVRLQLEPGLPPVLGDRVQIQQVMLNVLLNGLDALPQSDPGERRLVLQTRRHDGDMVQAEVQDTGPGLIEAERDRVFDAFYTTKAGGLGMGLAIARSIVEAHGGRLDAANAPGSGATFSFTLPVGGHTP